jgi:predicted TIM-barrel fold metal-dependent hydrolase
MGSIVTEIPIIDTDTHIQGPPDLWTARVPPALKDKVPQIRWEQETEEDVWYLQDVRMFPAGITAFAGHDGYPPDQSVKRFSDIPDALWDPRARLQRMDEYGIYAQILYPNLATFATASFAQEEERDIHNLCISVYNDFQAEWRAVAPDRFLPIAALPFWDIDLSLKELARCKEMGHHGLIFSQNPSGFGLPGLASRHWDPLWAAAQEMGMPVNFHIGSSGDDALQSMKSEVASMGLHAAFASSNLGFFLANSNTVSKLIYGGVCHRFPNLDFVSVESGVGWLRYALETMDWQWKNCGVHQEHPEYDLLPSEYFRRQIYGSFWFERETALFALETLEDNIFYETDFPHCTSMCPGPKSVAQMPHVYIEETLGHLPEETLWKVLHGNAARVYHL